jgi:class 3 adenylate cyclase/tetratricopeptide (TPR) repeat protein
VGSTSLTEREDPEVVQATIGRIFDRAALVIERYGGLLEKYMGDAILAVFGVPIAHEDDPERAVRAALEMQGVLSEMNRAAPGKHQLEMRIGVEAGDILVDLERAAGSRDRMLTGDAVNVAARLQSAAGIGRVLVGPVGFASTKGRIDYSDPELLALKGKAKPVPAYTALRAAAKQAGERPALGIEARMVGRAEELAVLQQTLKRVESEGRPALVTIFGPAGSGKSCLARELLRYLDDIDQTFFWRSGRCLPYGAVAYSGLADAIKAQCEVLENDTAEVTTEKVTRAVEDLGGDAGMLTAIEYLLGLSTEATLSREQLFEMWLKFLERMASRYPLVLVLEDIHWADEGLLDFIEFLADWARGGILILSMARPELLDKRPAWGGGKRNYASIYLDPLSVEESEQMLTELLGEAIPSEIKQLIIRRAEGNPLYTEEIVRMFIDRGLLAGSPEDGWQFFAPIDEIEIPRSIHALIAARLDGLAADEKSLLQDASVVGRVFWSGVTGRLAGQDTIKTREQLGRLRFKELITEREPSSFSDEREFGFHHALIRDVAYDSLSKQMRAKKHSVVAEWAEARTSTDREDVVELIATHYEQASAYMIEIGAPTDEALSLRAKAYEWSVRAAKHSMRVWQTAAALDWYQKTLASADSLPIDATEKAGLWESYALAAYGVLDDTEVAHAFDQALEIYGVVGADADLGRAMAAQALVLDQMSDERATSRAEEAVARLRATDDRRSLGGAMSALGRLYWRKGRWREASDAFEKGLEICRKEGDVESEIETTTDLAVSYWSKGDWDPALELAQRSYELATKAGTLSQVIRAGNNLGAALSTYGDPAGIGDAALAHVWELSRRHGHKLNQVYVGMNLANNATMSGRFDEAQIILETVLSEAPPSWATTKADFERYWAQLLVHRGDLADALSHIETAVAQDAGYEEVDLNLLGMRAMIDHHEGRVMEAVETFRNMVGRDRVEDVIGPYDALCALKVMRSQGEDVTAMRFADILHKKAGLIAQAYVRWCDGLLAEDPDERITHLEGAVGRFRHLRQPLLEAMCLTDLARLERDLGRDHLPAITKAIDFFRTAGAKLLLSEAEELLG